MLGYVRPTDHSIIGGTGNRILSRFGLLVTALGTSMKLTRLVSGLVTVKWVYSLGINTSRPGQLSLAIVSTGNGFGHR